MREFNFLGLSIISSARGPSSFLSLARPLSLSAAASLISWLSAGSRFVILANGVPFFQRPVFSPVIRPHPPKSTSTPPPYFRSFSFPPAPLALLYLTSPPSSIVSLMTYEVIKIRQRDNFSNAAYTDFP